MPAYLAQGRQGQTTDGKRADDGPTAAKAGADATRQPGRASDGDRHFRRSRAAGRRRLNLRPQETEPEEIGMPKDNAASAAPAPKFPSLKDIIADMEADGDDEPVELNEFPP